MNTPVTAPADGQVSFAETGLDEGEFLEVFSATHEEFLGWCRDGLVPDSKTLAAALTGEDVGVDVLAPLVSVAILIIVVVGGFLLTTRALTRFQVRSAD